MFSAVFECCSVLICEHGSEVLNQCLSGLLVPCVSESSAGVDSLKGHWVMVKQKPVTMLVVTWPLVPAWAVCREFFVAQNSLRCQEAIFGCNIDTVTVKKVPLTPVNLMMPCYKLLSSSSSNRNWGTIPFDHYYCLVLFVDR